MKERKIMPRVSTFTPEMMSEAIAFAREHSVSEAADKFNVSTPTIYAWIKKANGSGNGAPSAEAHAANGNGHETESDSERKAKIDGRARDAMERSAKAIETLRAENAALREMLAPALRLINVANGAH